jgi:iron complex outermembrane receptor protein
LGLTVRETPASVNVVTQQTMQEQGYRTNSDVAAGAVGVTSVDVAGAPAGFSMRGFSGDSINHLYNGIWLGAQDLNARSMDTFTFDRVEFLKGPSAIMSGVSSIGGSVNYVTKVPTSGPVQSEAFVGFDSLGSIRSGYGSGGSTPLPGLDYRFDVVYDHIKSFIDDDHKDLTSVTTRFNYQVSPVFKTWVAFEYYKDEPDAYWGTPLVSTKFAGPFATSGVVSGSESTHGFPTASQFLGPVTIDSRTLKTNYNVLDQFDGATQYWGRGGFEWAVAPGITLKNQSYIYSTTQTFRDSETYQFNPTTNLIDQDRFFVSHDQHVVGDMLNLEWNSHIAGMDNRFVAELDASHNEIRFAESTCTCTHSVAVVDPQRGLYGPLQTLTATNGLDTITQAFEDRLKITPTFALIGGVRVDEYHAFFDHTTITGATSPGYPFARDFKPVSYRAAYTWEPIPKLTFYSLYSTSYDPGFTNIFHLRPGTPIELTSTKLYETGVKQSLWNDTAEWTFAAYDITRRNAYTTVAGFQSVLAGEVHSQGVELAAAARPIEGLKLWGNIALTHTRYVNFVTSSGTSFSGKTPPDVAPIIANAGAAYRFEKQAWWHWLPVEVGASVRHVGGRFVYDDNEILMDPYTIADAYMFIDFDRPAALPKVDKTRLTLRVKNLTNKVYAAYADPGYPDQIYLGFPRTYEATLSFKW